MRGKLEVISMQYGEFATWTNIPQRKPLKAIEVKSETPEKH